VFGSGIKQWNLFPAMLTQGAKFDPVLVSKNVGHLHNGLKIAPKTEAAKFYSKICY